MRAIFWKSWYCAIVSFGVSYTASDIYAAHHSNGALCAEWVLGIALVTASAIAGPELVGLLKSGGGAYRNRDARTGR